MVQYDSQVRHKLELCRMMVVEKQYVFFFLFFFISPFFPVPFFLGGGPLIKLSSCTHACICICICTYTYTCTYTCTRTYMARRTNSFTTQRTPWHTNVKHPHAVRTQRRKAGNGGRRVQGRGIPLEGFLLAPIQRICKYPLLLNELLKATPEDHPDHADVAKAAQDMKKLADTINEDKRNAEQLPMIQDSIGGWSGPDLIETSSVHLHDGTSERDIDDASTLFFFLVNSRNTEGGASTPFSRECRGKGVSGKPPSAFLPGR